MGQLTIFAAMKRLLLVLVAFVALGVTGCQTESEVAPEIEVSTEVAFLQEKGYEVLGQLDNIGELMVFDTKFEGERLEVLVGSITPDILAIVYEGSSMMKANCPGVCYTACERVPGLRNPDPLGDHRPGGCLSCVTWSMSGERLGEEIVC